jgi:hypothetical protein
VSRASRSAASVALLGAGFAAVAFGAAGGTELGRTTSVEVLLILAGGAAVAAAVAFARPGPLHGGAALTFLAALAALTGLSVTWSIAPELSFVDAGRMFAYTAVFAAAVACARLAPRAAPLLLSALLVGAVAVLAYALASRVWPEALLQNVLLNRLAEP